MHCRSLIGWALAALPMLSGCGATSSALGGVSEKEARTAMTWNYARSAITIDLRSARRLNQYGGAAHTLVLGVVQMADPNLFNNLIADEPTVARLLATGQGAPAMLAVDRLVVEPGRTRTVYLDRAQSARYYGVIPGYYRLDPARNARLFEIPVLLDGSGLVVKTYSATPGPHHVRLVFGADRLVAAEPVIDPRTPEEREADMRESGADGDDAGDAHPPADATDDTRRLGR